MDAKELKKTCSKIKKFLQERKLEQIDIGLNLLRSLNESAVFEVLLKDCGIDENGDLIRNKIFSGTGPAQPYLDYALWNVILHTPENSKISKSLKPESVIHLVIPMECGFEKLPVFFEKCTKLQSLSLKETRLVNLDRLSNCINLERFNLSPASVSAETKMLSSKGDKNKNSLLSVEGLKSCPKLTVLELESGAFKNIPKGLGDLKALKSLNITDCTQLESFKGLEKCKLFYFSFNSCGITNLDFFPIMQTDPEGVYKQDSNNNTVFSSITGRNEIVDELTFPNSMFKKPAEKYLFKRGRYNNINTRDRISIEECKKLKNIDGLINMKDLVFLKISHSAKTGLESLKGLSNMSNLKVLNFWESGYPKNYNDLSKCTDLTNIKIENCTLSYSNEIRLHSEYKFPSGLDKIPNLHTLKITHNGPVVRQIDFGKGCKKLVKLELNFPFRNKRFSYSSSVKPLKTAEKEERKDIKLLISAIEKCSNLNSLTIRALERNLEFNINSLSKLKLLDLSHCSSIKSIKFLKNMINLERLNLTRCSSLKSLEGIESCKKLTSINLQFCSALIDLDPLLHMSKQKLSLDKDSKEYNKRRAKEEYENNRKNKIDARYIKYNCWLNGCSSLENLNGLANFTNLYSLQLEGCDSLQDLTGIEGLIRLRELKAPLSTIGDNTSFRSGLFPIINLSLTYLVDTNVDRINGTKYKVFNTEGKEMITDYGVYHGVQIVIRDLTKDEELIKDRADGKRTYQSPIQLFCFQLAILKALMNNDITLLTHFEFSDYQKDGDGNLVRNKKKQIKYNYKDITHISLSGIDDIKDVNILSSFKKLKKLDLSNCNKLENVNGISHISCLRYLDLTQSSNVQPNARPLKMETREKVASYQIKILKYTQQEIPKGLSDMASKKLSKPITLYSTLNKEQKVNITKLKKLFRSRNYAAIDTGIELMKSLGDVNLYEFFLEDSIIENGKLIPGKILKGTKPEQVYLNRVFIGLIATKPDTTKTHYSLSSDITHLDLSIEDLPPTISLFKELEILSVSGCRNLKSLQGIEKLKKLKTLNADNTGLISAETIQKCKNLENLNLKGTRLSTLSLDSLPLITLKIDNCFNLKDLYLSNLTYLTHISAKGIAESYRYAGLNYYFIPLKELKINNLTALEQINLSWLYPLRKLSITNCQSLNLIERKEMRLNYSKQSTNDIEINNLPKLKILNLNKLPFSSTKKIKKLSSIKRIEMLDCNELVDLNGLSEMSALEELSIKGAKFTSISKLKDLQNLTEVSLIECKNLLSLNGLEGNKNLSSLALNGCSIIQDVNAIRSLNQLNRVDFTGCKQVSPMPKPKNLKEKPEVITFQSRLLKNKPK